MKLLLAVVVICGATLAAQAQVPVVGPLGQTGLAQPYKLPSNGVTVCVIPMVATPEVQNEQQIQAQLQNDRSQEQQTIVRATHLLRRASRYLKQQGFIVVDGFVPWARRQLASDQPSATISAEVGTLGCGEGERYDLRIYPPAGSSHAPWPLPEPWRSSDLTGDYFLTVGAPDNLLSRQGPYAGHRLEGVLASFTAVEQNPALASELRYQPESERQQGVPSRAVSSMIGVALLQYIHGRLKRVQPGLPACQLEYGDGFYATCRFQMTENAPNGQPYMVDYPVFFRRAEDGPVELPAGNFVVNRVGRPQLIAPEAEQR